MKNKIRAVISIFICILCLLPFVPVHSSAFAVSRSAGTVNITSGRLNVRSAPSLSASVVTGLTKGTYVTIYEAENAFFRVEYAEDKFGYCSKTYIAEIQGAYAAEVNITSGYLNVRSGRGTTYAVTDRLYKGDELVVIDVSSGWAQIVFNGGSTGFVSNAYIKKSELSSSAVSLNILNFKQTDLRWKNVTLGNSGKSIGSVGCTTTCLAMTESYRTGSIVYPDSMAGRLSYSASGSLYWPSNYITDVSGASWLYRVKNIIASGKPVILGCKNYSGSMHWVVITGYKNGGATASDFFINDPGSAYRTLLSDFTSLYPLFYKLAYYQ